MNYKIISTPQNFKVLDTPITPTPVPNTPGYFERLGQGYMQTTKDLGKDFTQAGTAIVNARNPLEAIGATAKGLFRSVGDLAGAVYSPIGTAVGMGVEKIGQTFPGLAKTVSGGVNVAGEALATQLDKIPGYSKFILNYPEAEADFGRLMNIAVAAKDTGKIDPKTVVERTIKQVESGAATVGNAITDSIDKVQKIRQEHLVNNRIKTLETIEGSKASIRKYVEKQTDKGFNPKTDIAKTDLLSDSVDDTGTIRTKSEGGAIDKYNQFIKPQEDVISNVLKKEGKSLPIEVVKTKLVDAVNNSGMKGASKQAALAKIDAEVEAYKLELNPEGKIPLSAIQDAKIDKYSNVNYLNEGGRVDKLIAKGLKQLVEENTKSVDVKALNNELARHYANIGYLEALDGAKVEGGRFGKYAAGAIGAAVGSTMGPVGTIVGADVATRIKGAQMKYALSGRAGGQLESSSAMRNAIGQSNSVGNLNQSQSNTMVNSMGDITPNTTINPSDFAKLPVDAQRALTLKGLVPDGIIPKVNVAPFVQDIVLQLRGYKFNNLADKVAQINPNITTHAEFVSALKKATGVEISNPTIQAVIKTSKQILK